MAIAIPAISHAAESIFTDNAGVTIEYSPEFADPWTDSDGNLQLLLRDGTFVRQPNQPEIPVRFVTVAVPPGSKPTSRIISWDDGETLQGTFATHPAEEVIDDRHQTLSSIDDDNLEVRSLLGLATVRIPLYPARIQAGSVTTARKIVARVDFHAPVKIVSTSSVRINRLHQLLVVNAGQASTWQRYRTSAFDMEGWPSGYLYSFEVEEEGIYRLNFEDLAGNGVDIDNAGIPSNQIKLFGNGGLDLPLNPESDVPAGLIECAIYVEDGGDGRFNPGDWLLFYGRGAGGFKVDSASGITYSLNHYTLKNLYWLNIDPSGNGKRMAGIPVQTTADDTVGSGLSSIHLENDKFIYGGSSFPGAGREWYGFTFDGPSRIVYNVNLPYADPNVPAKIVLRIVKATGGYDASIKLNINGISLDTTIRPEYYYTEGRSTIEIPAGVLHPGVNTVYLEQTRQGAADALFDWLEIYYQAKLEGTVTFGERVSDGTVYKSTLSNPWLFDISNPSEVKLGRGVFAATPIAYSYRRFILTRPEEFRRIVPRFREYFPPESDISNLFSSSNRADILLIVPDNFYDAIEPLYDHYSRRNPPLNAARIRLSEVYNRFSGGLRDPAAIRNLLHFAKDYWAVPPQYVLLCGDGDYNYRDLNRSPNPDLLPPYESGYDKSSICSDDWFTDFTPLGRDLLPEMAIGRLTANYPWELKAIAEKIVAYDEEPEFGLWRNRVTLVADDESSETSNYEYEHVEFSEQLASSIIPGFIDKVKVFETEYDREAGRDKPMATETLLSSINDGTLIVNYMGHGNPNLWAHERLFVVSRDINRIKPSRRLPLYIAFTCDWAYWDDPSSQSFPERLLANPDGGAIAAIASTRLTYSPPNQTLSQYFYLNQFSDDNLTTGEALWRSKHQGWSSTSPTYHLLGDPSLMLAIPKRRGRFLGFNPFPLPPLARVSMNGEALQSNGSIDQDFSGEVIFSLRDSSIPRQYVIGEDESAITLNYTMPGAIAYRGFLSLTEGRFEGDFIVPRDVTLNGQRGKAVAYFYNDEIDGIAFVDTIKFAGRAIGGLDTIPPEIELYFDHRGYRQGDDVGSEPIAIIDISDSSGINLTGAMGHGIWLTIGDLQPVNLTKSFRYHLDSYQQGSLEQQLEKLQPGSYPVKVEAWDSYNNLAVLTGEIDVIDAAGGLVIDRILNWPNPFHETTALTFMINRPADYEIKIFTVAGRMIRNFHGYADSNGLVKEVIWDGRDLNGARVGNGVYLYKVIARDNEGGKAEGLGRIAFIR